VILVPDDIFDLVDMDEVNLAECLLARLASKAKAVLIDQEGLDVL